MQLFRKTSIFFGLPFALAAAMCAQTSDNQAAQPQSNGKDASPSTNSNSAPSAVSSPFGPPNDDQVEKGVEGRYTLRTQAYEVLLNVTVLDSSGKEALNVPAKSFHITEDSVPQRISSFRHEDLPVSIGLLVDNSSSMYNKQSAVEKAALDLLRLSNPKDEAFIVHFGSRVYLDQDLTSSFEKLQQGFRQTPATGETVAYDAVAASAQYLAGHGKNTKQVLILVTDGTDTSSRLSLADMILRVRKLDGPTIYCVGLLFGEDMDKDDARRAKEVLQQVADQTGGAAFFPKDINHVEDVAAVIANDVRSQYTIGYRPTNPPSNGGYRVVHIEAFGAKNEKLNVRARTGYSPKASSLSKPAETK